ncbi:hypothetical protein ASC94_26990 [Massilia sp. Root418]|jgi:hypothetical protein|uniref:hypothetical protein n=1 Tax=Massilia sp. Root418 TaxID=1736532 RepID=UPI0006F882C0|nr:hypothetical protein [Massilia sp. Root418]KQW87074.1 hypothetical protein ASC94_26990 [Massilia sp. Root418]
MDEFRPYTRSLDDELDWKRLDQLYGVVTQLSGFCFETKKFCVTTEFVILALLAKITHGTLDRAFFIAGVAIPLCFWFLDAVAYFYQVKLRGAMDDAYERVRERNRRHLVDGVGALVISQQRVAGALARRVANAALNHSMWLYVLLVGADLVVWNAFRLGYAT